ncbi:hypothetical protein A3J20_01815 [Candidatus Gottesmanbacteria bacterium RIFCSPLOWO2_02_FULL_42_29]|uniref:Uncharacterized protein n=2 Tax=Candidatus Gottesmaniibacteriota TaxID=1752720 RepID=A0A1F6BDY9_9BACT|nr:MAG: hypothetical protein UV09_C0002G0005 [Candidatus Gottesmanbacteria bacterium GW2011_GWA2_42_18]OGG12188.1 MAG: hypothetical protein A2781_04690 [Candidatus Gottesmanbacteria bacterium RIFCSPHIGHO2_01_FULL_42_27]OGG19918.1 MAG: hypothetical protein A3E72_02780 [Candidatus Gottesmanbacteria bacterium RIFCSPHIGHO2_12_FULL_43_26]OGG33071.1 MAG: hypothetical protein A3G68_00045 [Candidatus Gottesmanbacteria bacterium RIFCSPLOWO2_12_FULL_42_10]OGG35013.1 MAG: hypothetical protein A2968_00055 
MDRDSNYTHFAILILLLVISVNLLIIDLKIFSPAADLRLSESKTEAAPEQNRIGIFDPKQQNISCPSDCLSSIKSATESLVLRTGNPPITAENNYQPQTTKEYFIPLGTGTTSKNSWDNLIATETVIDTSVYGTIKEAYFIAGLKNPTGNGQVEAQIYNVTDKNPVWGSHVIMNGPTEQTITSGKIGLANGGKLYRVQLKSSIGYEVNLENARIRILAY